FVTQSSYARFSGLSHQAISKRSRDLEVLEIPENELEKGTATLVAVPLIRTRFQNKSGSSEVVLIPAKVFGKWLIKDKPELADEMLEAGATQFLYKIAGYEIKAVEQKPKSNLELAQLMLDELKEHEKKILALEASDKENKMRLQAVEELADANSDELDRFRNGHGYWYSIVGYYHKHDLGQISVRESATIGRRATALCKKSGIKPERINDPIFGKVNTYPEHLLDELILG
ncbi:hypothetical protein, partial [Okeania sp. SIO2G5]|uniref:hypothetical protein n=1 Tax=Okeania sp. SIO2G5 TaxID=2607796 RepID=UPI0013C1DCE3